MQGCNSSSLLGMQIPWVNAPSHTHTSVWLLIIWQDIKSRIPLPNDPALPQYLNSIQMLQDADRCLVPLPTGRFGSGEGWGPSQGTCPNVVVHTGDGNALVQTQKDLSTASYHHLGKPTQNCLPHGTYLPVPQVLPIQQLPLLELKTSTGLGPCWWPVTAAHPGWSHLNSEVT